MLNCYDDCITIAENLDYRRDTGATEAGVWPLFKF
jgi:hypothetical protein